MNPAGDPEAALVDADTVWTALLDERVVDDDMRWWAHLSSRAELVAKVAQRIADERARIAVSWHISGDSFATIGERVGLTRARAQQLVERGRRLPR